MPFLTLTGGLTIQVPTKGTTNWEETLRLECFQKISEHDHTGGGKGLQLGSGSIVDDSMTDLKVRLRFDQFLRSRNEANSADVSILRITTSDKLEIAPEISAVIKLSNNIAIQGRNQADDAYLDMMKINTSDKLEIPLVLALPLRLDNDTALQSRNAADDADIDLIKLDANNKKIINNIKTDELISNGSFTMVNNQAVAADVTGVLAAGEETIKLEYQILRDGTADLKQTGELVFNLTEILSEEYSGDDSGITFSVNAGQLQYTSTDNPGSTNERLSWIIKRLGE
jgi:hypothetical protein